MLSRKSPVKTVPPGSSTQQRLTVVSILRQTTPPAKGNTLLPTRNVNHNKTISQQTRTNMPPATTFANIKQMAYYLHSFCGKLP